MWSMNKAEEKYCDFQLTNVFKMSTRNGRSKLFAESNAQRTKISIYVVLGLFMDIVWLVFLPSEKYKNIFKIFFYIAFHILSFLWDRYAFQSTFCSTKGSLILSEE